MSNVHLVFVFSLWLWKHNYLSLFPIMSFSRGGGGGGNQSLESCWSFQPFTLGLRKRRLSIVIVNSVAYIWAFIQISSVVYSEICMQTRSSGVSPNISTASSPSLRDVYKPDHGLVTFVVFPTLSPHGFLLCFLDLDPNSRFKAGQWTERIIVHFLNKILKQSEKEVDINT